MNTTKTKAFGTAAADAPLQLMDIQRRDLTPDDVEIEILFCGVCHSDLHTARNDWGGTIYPAVPGHEIVGRVTKTGSNVIKFKTGDFAAVGCLVDSCRTCKTYVRKPTVPLDKFNFRICKSIYAIRTDTGAVMRHTIVCAVQNRPN